VRNSRTKWLGSDASAWYATWILWAVTIVLLLGVLIWIGIVIT
jgi:hypothetical protein